jgi:hypothetical protein
MKEYSYTTNSPLGPSWPGWVDLYFAYMKVLTVKTKWAIGTIICGSGNKKL